MLIVNRVTRQSHANHVAAMQIAVREAKRQNATYRPHGLKALAQVAAARRDVDLFDTIKGVVTPLLDEVLQDDPMEVDNDTARSSSSTAEV